MTSDDDRLSFFSSFFPTPALDISSQKLAPFAFVKKMDGDYVGPAVPNNQFKKRSNRTLKSEANDRAVKNISGRVERTVGPATAQRIRVELRTLRDNRVARASYWVSQMSSTEQEAESLDCQIL